MEEYQSIIQTITLVLGVAWASSINLYATVAMLGLDGTFGYVYLPAQLEVVQDTMVILAAGFMYCVEFMADKTPGVDTGWDALHTFVRIPAGTMLAAGALGDASPEPFSNWGASILEDIAVFVGLWAALQHPVLFLIAFAIFLLLICWLLPKIWRGVRGVFRKLAGWLGLTSDGDNGRLEELKKLTDAGILPAAEYQAARNRLASA